MVKSHAFLLDQIVLPSADFPTRISFTKSEFSENKISYFGEILYYTRGVTKWGEGVSMFCFYDENLSKISVYYSSKMLCNYKSSSF